MKRAIYIHKRIDRQLHLVHLSCYLGFCGWQLVSWREKNECPFRPFLFYMYRLYFMLMILLPFMLHILGSSMWFILLLLLFMLLCLHPETHLFQTPTPLKSNVMFNLKHWEVFSNCFKTILSAVVTAMALSEQVHYLCVFFFVIHKFNMSWSDLMRAL